MDSVLLLLNIVPGLPLELHIDRGNESEPLFPKIFNVTYNIIHKKNYLYYLIMFYQLNVV